MDMHDLGLHGVGGIAGSPPYKSIQQGTYALAAASGTVTISSVDLTKAVVIIASKNYAGTNMFKTAAHCTAALTNSTTITFARGYNDGTLTVTWYVIEFNNVKSIQRGTVTPTAATSTTAVTTVTIAKSILFVTDSNVSIGGQGSEVRGATAEGYLSTSSQITFVCAGSSYVTIAWQLLEFN